MSGSTSRKNSNVGQALVANKPARQHRKQEVSGKNDRTGTWVWSERAFPVVVLLQPNTTTATV